MDKYKSELENYFFLHPLVVESMARLNKKMNYIKKKRQNK